MTRYRGDDGSGNGRGTLPDCASPPKEQSDISENDSSEEHPRFVRSSGSRVGGQHKDKKQRITDALSDLRLMLAGLASAGDGRQNASEMIQATGSLARACSVFLRKVVLGDGRDRGARLLDDSVLSSLEMRLQPLRKIPREVRRTVETGFRTERVALQITRLDDATEEPIERYMAVGGVHRPGVAAGGYGGLGRAPHRDKPLANFCGSVIRH